jgi:hypothetical protein
MALSRLGVELLDHNKPARSVTLPKFNLPDLDVKAIEAEARQAQARVRVIRAGRDAWQQSAKSGSFSLWADCGRALQVGRDFALRVTGANRPEGRRYCAEFSQWIEAHGFAGMQKSVHSVAIELAENIEAIEAWRATLPEKQRRRLVHPLSNVRRWRAATGQYEIQRSRDLKWDAQTAWRKFCACLQQLPADQAAPLWQAAQTDAAAVLGATL